MTRGLEVAHHPSVTVGHVLPFPAVGGTEVATRRIALATRPHGLEHVIFHRPDAPQVAEYFHDAGLKTIPFIPPRPSLVRHLPAFLHASRTLARQFREAGLTTVHGADILGGQMAGLAGRMAGLRVLCHVRNQYQRLPARDCLALRPVETFIFVSRRTRDIFYCHRARARGIVLYDGIDPPARTADRAEVRRALGIPAAVPVIGMVARVAPQKDYATLVEAMREVHRQYPTARLLLVGDTSSTAGYRAHAAEVRVAIAAAGLGDCVQLTGHREDVPALLDALDIFVLVTHAEGLPLVLLEAMAHGLPVVATAVDGVTELVQDGTTGFLHCHQDAGQLAARLATLLANPALRARLGSAARERVRASFSNAQFTTSLLALYRGPPASR